MSDQEKTPPETDSGPGSLQPGAKGSPGLEDTDPANTIPTPAPATDPMHEGGP